MCKCRGIIILLLSCFPSGILATTPQMVYTCNVGDNVTLFCVGIISGKSSKDIITSKDIMMLHTSIYWNTSTKMVNVSDITQYDGGVNENPSLTIIYTTCSDAGYYTCTCVDNAFVGQSLLLVTVDCGEEFSDDLGTGAIVAIVIAVFGLILSVIQVYCTWKAKRDTPREPASFWWSCCFCPWFKSCISLRHDNTYSELMCWKTISCSCIPVVIIQQDSYTVKRDGDVDINVSMPENAAKVSWKKYKDHKFQMMDDKFIDTTTKALKLQQCKEQNEADYICKVTNWIRIGTKSKTKLILEKGQRNSEKDNQQNKGEQESKDSTDDQTNKNQE